MIKRQGIEIYFDGEDYIHESDLGFLVSHHKLFNPYDVVGNSKLFTAEYSPKIGDTVFDLGAGTGIESIFLSQLVGETGHIFAIEADPIVYRRLEKSVKLSSQKNVITINCAIGQIESSQYLNQISEEGQGNYLSSSPLTDKTIKVSVVSLDSIFEKFKIEKVNLMKINIEGSEFNALLGLRQNLYKVDNFVISCHDFLEGSEFKTYDRVKSFLQDQDFTVCRAPENLKMPWESWYLYAYKNSVNTPLKSNAPKRTNTQIEYLIESLDYTMRITENLKLENKLLAESLDNLKSSRSHKITSIIISIFTFIKRIFR